jgi:hypothetical protein
LPTFSLSFFLFLNIRSFELVKEPSLQNHIWYRYVTDVNKQQNRVNIKPKQHHFPAIYLVGKQCKALSPGSNSKNLPWLAEFTIACLSTRINFGVL